MVSFELEAGLPLELVATLCGIETYLATVKTEPLFLGH
jgi:hypothetical protein